MLAKRTAQGGLNLDDFSVQLNLYPTKGFVQHVKSTRATHFKTAYHPAETFTAGLVRTTKPPRVSASLYSLSVGSLRTVT